MSNLSKSIRHKRFEVKANPTLRFSIETKLGTQLELTLVNCSISGLGGLLDTTSVQLDEAELMKDEIIPSSKVHWDDHEYALGRLVLRSIRKTKEGEKFLGFSTVDSKVPIDGPLSNFLKIGKNKGSAYDYELSSDKFNLSNFSSMGEGNNDLFARCRQFEIFHDEWKDSDKYLYSTIRTPSKGTRIHLTRKRSNGRNDYLIMGSNDYLGLAAHPEIERAAKEALNRYGFGSTGSPLTTGLTDLHLELEEFVAKLFRKQRCMLFNSGYAANLGAISGLTGDQDLIVSDVITHASIQDAMQLSTATSRFFKHNNMIHLEKVLQEQRGQHSGTLVISEGVFSMDGDVAPVKDIVKLARKFNARTLIDEAHSFGVLGPNGLGACEKFDVIDQTDIIMGTFSKICGSIGGFICGDKSVIDWLNFHARSRMFSVSLPPSTVAATLKALEIFVETGPEVLMKLRSNIRHFVKGLRDLGVNLDPNHESAVVPVVIGDEKKLGEMNRVLFDSGVYVIPVVYPAVSRDACRFRFTIMANHSVSDLDFVINVLEKAMIKADFSFGREGVEQHQDLKTNLVA